METICVSVNLVFFIFDSLNLLLISLLLNCPIFRGTYTATIIGNDHAIFHYENLLNQVEELDYVCISDEGENTLIGVVKYLMKMIKTLSEINGLAYRYSGNIFVNNRTSLGYYKRNTYFDNLAIPNRKLLSKRYWEQYLRNFKRQRHKSIDVNKITGVSTINRARGCARNNSPCKYCGIADLSLRGSSGSIFWKDVEQGIIDIGANYFYEAFDSASSWYSLIDDWVKSKPKNIDVNFFLYSQANETNEKVVNNFIELGVKSVNVGFDSGDNIALKLLKSDKNSVELNKKAALLWTNSNIDIHTSFVLTAIGDEQVTRNSLEKTIKFVEWLALNTSVVSLDSAVLYPDRSSVVGRWIWNPEIALKEAKLYGWTFVDLELLSKVSDKWRNKIFIDSYELASDFAEICGTSIDILIEYDREINNISSKYGLNYGNSQGGRK